MHKKRGITEVSSLLTVGFAIYQGNKHGVINPDLIGQLFVHSYDIASLAIPALILAARITYKKWFRKPKTAVIAADRLKEDLNK